MKIKLIIILFIFPVLVQAASVLDSIVIEDISTIWTNEEGYSISNVKMAVGGTIREYSNQYFYKNVHTGYYINKLDGSIYKKISMNYVKGDKYNWDNKGSWDIASDDIDKIIMVDFSFDSYLHFKMTSLKDGIVDSVYSYTSAYDQNLYNKPSPMFGVYSINKDQYLLYFDYFMNEGPSLSPRIGSVFVDIESNYVFKSPHGILLQNLNVNKPNNIFLTTNPNVYEGSYEYRDGADSHDFFELKNDTFQLIAKYTAPENMKSWFKEILNDSLSTIIIRDSIMVFNFRNKTVPKSYFLDAEDKVIAKYHFEDKKIIALIIKQADGDKRVFAFHYPSYKILLDEIDNAPYLGEMLGELNDGNLLTIGDDSYIYKHKWKYDFNTVVAEFDYKLVDDNKIEFGDLSEGPIKSWKWDFGDGTTSNERNPVHQFASSGKYFVILTATNEYGKEHQTSKEVVAKGVLKSNFEYTVSQDGDDRIVECTNLSPDIAVRYIWNFGDGTYSNEKNPIHRYNFTGKYYISLTAFDSEGNYKIYLKDEVIEVP
jgi:PKD domain-containing protein